MICQMLDWGASDFGTDLGRCHFIGAVQNEEESIKVREEEMVAMASLRESKLFIFSCDHILQYLIILMKMKMTNPTQMTLTAAPGSIPGKNHGLRLIMDAEVKIYNSSDNFSYNTI